MSSAMLSIMTQWWQTLLSSITTFLMSEPIIYIVGICVLLFIVKFIKSLFRLAA